MTLGFTCLAGMERLIASDTNVSFVKSTALINGKTYVAVVPINELENSSTWASESRPVQLSQEKAIRLARHALLKISADRKTKLRLFSIKLSRVSFTKDIWVYRVSFQNAVTKEVIGECLVKLNGEVIEFRRME